MNEEERINEASDHTEEQGEETNERAEECEFKLTVRKLEMPVRPRGVLADG